MYLWYTLCVHEHYLNTQTVTDVTRTANRERVPNGTLPKLGRVPLPYGKINKTTQEEKTTLERCASLLSSTVMLSSREHVAAAECFCLTDAIAARIYWPSKIYIQVHSSGITGVMFLSFTVTLHD